ncbi:LOW QUALITY PROTEIN: hypothetical protein QC762_0001090 [Podospora pseudocomata]|uniref:Uncharacterized protein n=1 Tax=Podospora pseudocomata TaxID=2093779 RepID=A0ABR0GSF7_9PEZI|nr:LOW QUALITY PROTEIN: hypothetical protein QC762_0001090 [Podospora pseudocomata]
MCLFFWEDPWTTPARATRRSIFARPKRCVSKRLRFPMMTIRTRTAMKESRDNIEEDDSQYADSLSFSPPNSDDKILTDAWLRSIVDLNPADHEADTDDRNFIKAWLESVVGLRPADYEAQNDDNAFDRDCGSDESSLIGPG